MATKVWECIITRQVRIERPEKRFEDYTDWLSDDITGRINPVVWGDFILDCTGEPICTAYNEEIEEVKVTE